MDLSAGSHKGGLGLIPTPVTGFGVRFTLGLLLDEDFRVRAGEGLTGLVITRPDDWHLHLRDGELLRAVLPHTSAGSPAPSSCPT